jgi:hypothetical protein
MNGQVRLDAEVAAPGKPGQKEHEPIMEDGGHVPIKENGGVCMGT